MAKVYKYIKDGVEKKKTVTLDQEETFLAQCRESNISPVLISEEKDNIQEPQKDDPIDNTIDEIKKISRKVCTNDYAANNVYIMLQDALKKVTLADK